VHQERRAFLPLNRSVGGDPLQRRRPEYLPNWKVCSSTQAIRQDVCRMRSRILSQSQCFGITLSCNYPLEYMNEQFELDAEP
jgi:hypothetical protein